MRLLYLFYLEMCISLMLSLNSDYESTAGEKFLTFIVSLLVIGLFTGLTVCCFRGGPFMPNTYAKGSLLSSFWHYRRLSDKSLAMIQAEIGQINTERERLETMKFYSRRLFWQTTNLESVEEASSA